MIWQRLMSSTLTEFGLTHVQFVLLASTWWLEEHGEPPRGQRDLADHAGADPMMTSQVVRALQAKGLLSRTTDLQDARAVRLTVTQVGQGLATRAVAAVEAADAGFFAALPHVDRERIAPLLQVLAGVTPKAPQHRATPTLIA